VKRKRLEIESKGKGEGRGGISERTVQKGDGKLRIMTDRNVTRKEARILKKKDEVQGRKRRREQGFSGFVRSATEGGDTGAKRKRGRGKSQGDQGGDTPSGLCCLGVNGEVRNRDAGKAPHENY